MQRRSGIHRDEDSSEEEFDDDGILEGIKRAGGGLQGRTASHDDDFEFGIDHDDDDDGDDHEDEEDSEEDHDARLMVRRQHASHAAASLHHRSKVGSAEVSADTKRSEPRRGSSKPQVLYNQPFDEVLEAGSDSDTLSDRSSENGELETAYSTPGQHPPGTTRRQSVQQSSDAQRQPNQGQQQQQRRHHRYDGEVGGFREQTNTSDDDDDDEEEEEDDDDDHSDDDDDEDEDNHTDSNDEDGPGQSRSKRGVAKEYDPNAEEFAKLAVPSEVKSMFSFISAYGPHNIDLELQQKPFIPDYIPSVGDLDPFLKVPRPDGRDDMLGLTLLDEPNAVQSDPAVVALNLQYTSRDTQTRSVEVVSSIEHANRNPKRVMKWVDDVKKLHANKPPPTVSYSKPMPDVDQLMQAWPDQFEELLSEIDLPSADMDLSLGEYVRLVCAVLDIPVHNDNLIQSLHVLFTTYVDFTTNQHFGAQINTL